MKQPLALNFPKGGFKPGKSKFACILTVSLNSNDVIYKNKLGITFEINSEIFFHVWFNVNGLSKKEHGSDSCFNSFSHVFNFSFLKQV